MNVVTTDKSTVAIQTNVATLRWTAFKWASNPVHINTAPSKICKVISPKVVCAAFRIAALSLLFRMNCIAVIPMYTVTIAAT